MENNEIAKRENVKWFLGGVAIASIALLGYRKYELTVIGMGIQNIVSNPELLADFQNKIKPVIR